MSVHAKNKFNVAGIIVDGENRPEQCLEVDHNPSLRSFIADYGHWNSCHEFMSVPIYAFGSETHHHMFPQSQDVGEHTWWQGGRLEELSGRV